MAVRRLPVAGPVEGEIDILFAALATRSGFWTIKFPPLFHTEQWGICFSSGTTQRETLGEGSVKDFSRNSLHGYGGSSPVQSRKRTSEREIMGLAFADTGR